MKKALIIFNPTAGLSTKQDVKALVSDKLKDLGYQPEVLLLDFDFGFHGYIVRGTQGRSGKN